VRHHRPRGVEDHRVAHRALGAAQHRAHLGGVGLRVPTDQRGQIGAWETERGRIEGEPLDGSGLHPPDGARRGGGELVESVITVHHQHAGAPGGEHAGHHLGQIRPGATDQARARGGWVGQRAEQVEHRRHADLAPHHRRVPVGRVELRREREPDAHLAHTALHLLGAQVDPHPERLESVGAAGQRRRGPVAVLDHRHPARRHHDRRHRRQVDRVVPVATGADDVDGVGADLVGGHPAGVRQHDLGQLVHLGGGGPLHPQRHRERRDLGGCRRAGHDLVHGPGGMPDRERLVGGQAGQDGRPRRSVGQRHRPRLNGCH